MCAAVTIHPSRLITTQAPITAVHFPPPQVLLEMTTGRVNACAVRTAVLNKEPPHANSQLEPTVAAAQLDAFGSYIFFPWHARPIGSQI